MQSLAHPLGQLSWLMGPTQLDPASNSLAAKSIICKFDVSSVLTESSPCYMNLYYLHISNLEGFKLTLAQWLQGYERKLVHFIVIS